MLLSLVTSVLNPNDWLLSLAMPPWSSNRGLLSLVTQGLRARRHVVEFSTLCFFIQVAGY